MTLLVTPVSTPEQFEIAKKLRFQVYVDEKGFDAAVEIDDLDSKDTTIHFIGKDVEQDEYVAVARCLMDPVNRAARIGRVAVLPEYRRKRYGFALMDAVENHVADQVDTFGLSALCEKKGFYKKRGYRCLTDETYLERGALHCWLVKDSPKK